MVTQSVSLSVCPIVSSTIYTPVPFKVHTRSGRQYVIEIIAAVRVSFAHNLFSRRGTTRRTCRLVIDLLNALPHSRDLPVYTICRKINTQKGYSPPPVDTINQAIPAPPIEVVQLQFSEPPRNKSCEQITSLTTSRPTLRKAAQRQLYTLVTLVWLNCLQMIDRNPYVYVCAASLFKARLLRF